MTLNGLMYAERKNYLQQSSSNKGNGYRKIFAVAEDLKNVFDLDYRTDTLELAIQRLNVFSLKWSKKHSHIGNLSKNEMN